MQAETTKRVKGRRVTRREGSIETTQQREGSGADQPPGRGIE